MRRFSCLIITVVVMCFLSCKKQDKVESLGSEKEMMPIVMVHGFLASGDTYELQMLRFASNGYPMDMLYTYEWNTLGMGSNSNQLLDDFISEVLLKTGKSQVDLVGHSAGSFLVYDYCKNPDRGKKVRNVVLLAGTVQPGAAGYNNIKIPTLNIFSPYDKVVTGGGNIKGATNISLKLKDHYQVATSIETFEAIYHFFRNRAPSTLEIIKQDDPQISGKVLSFGENLSGKGASLNVYELDAITGMRKNELPDFSFQVNDKNEWGPFQAKSGAYYEFRVKTDQAGDRPVHYYREPFLRDNKTVIIRSFPPKGSLGAAFLNALPTNNQQAVMAFFGASQAMIAGRDILNVNGIELSNSKYAAQNNTTIALFMYDSNENQFTDDKSIAAFSAFPFLAGADIYFPTDTETMTTVTFNGRRLKMRNFPSGDEGVSVAVFD